MGGEIIQWVKKDTRKSEITMETIYERDTRKKNGWASVLRRGYGGNDEKQFQIQSRVNAL